MSLIFDPVSDGKHVIFAMFIVGCIFLAVIAFGEFAHRLGDRRREKKSRLYPY